MRNYIYPLLLILVFSTQTFAWDDITVKIKTTNTNSMYLRVIYDREDVAKIKINAESAKVVKPTAGIDYPADLLGNPSFKHVLLIDNMYRIPLNFEVHKWDGVIWIVEGNKQINIKEVEMITKETSSNESDFYVAIVKSFGGSEKVPLPFQLE